MFARSNCAGVLPDPHAGTVVAVPLWGIDWTCSFRRDGTVDAVKLHGRWLDARDTLRDSICDALESQHRAMEVN